MPVMTNPELPVHPDIFAALRPRLFAIAYRMLGTRADATCSDELCLFKLCDKIRRFVTRAHQIQPKMAAS